MFFFSNTLLLAVTCLLVKAGLITERTTTCDPTAVHRLSCDWNSVIGVETSFYGRMDSVTCAKGIHPTESSDTSCSLVNAAEIVKNRCNGKRVCELNTDTLGTSDPCRGTANYLYTTYTCLPAIHRVTCEHSVINLDCDKGQVLFVYSADYGRRDPNICVYDRPANELQNTACSSPTNKVADSCNGKTSCNIQASNSVFGDPCYGTYKYLEVVYMCRYPEATQAHSV